MAARNVAPLPVYAAGRATVSLGAHVPRDHINIRESTVLGIVGAGGIGFLLNEAILGLEWAPVGLILVVILGVVALFEIGSAWIRRRVT